MFIDVHCHLDYIEKELDEIIEKCNDKNVKILLTQGTNHQKNIKSLEIAGKYNIVKCCLGLYPIEALGMSDKDIDKEIDFIRKNKDEIIAIGEIGIDFKECLNLEERERQKNIFKKILNLSLEIDKPIIVHSRKAEIETIEIIEEMKIKKVIMHCFSGSMKLVDRISSNGWMLSIPANVVFSEHFQKVVERTNIDNLFCETDSPYLSPEKGKFPNTPENVIESYRKIAEIKKIELKELEKNMESNFYRVFGRI